jgi:hypothetical protein
MSYIVLITKAKEENPYWGPKKLLSELKLGYTERTAKGMLTLYFYDTEVGYYGRCIAYQIDVHFRAKICMYFYLVTGIGMLDNVVLCHSTEVFFTINLLEKVFYVLSDKCLMDSFCLSVIFLVGFSPVTR